MNNTYSFTFEFHTSDVSLNKLAAEYVEENIFPLTGEEEKEVINYFINFGNDDVKISTFYKNKEFHIALNSGKMDDFKNYGLLIIDQTIYLDNAVSNFVQALCDKKNFVNDSNEFLYDLLSYVKFLEKIYNMDNKITLAQVLAINMLIPMLDEPLEQGETAIELVSLGFSKENILMLHNVLKNKFTTHYVTEVLQLDSNFPEEWLSIIASDCSD